MRWIICTPFAQVTGPTCEVVRQPLFLDFLSLGGWRLRLAKWEGVLHDNRRARRGIAAPLARTAAAGENRAGGGAVRRLPGAGGGVAAENPKSALLGGVFRSRNGGGKARANAQN